MDRNKKPAPTTISNFEDSLIELVRTQVRPIMDQAREALLKKLDGLFFLYDRLDDLARAEDLRRDAREGIIMAEVRKALPIINFYLSQDIPEEKKTELMVLRGYIKGVAAPVLPRQDEKWDDLMSLDFSLGGILSAALADRNESSPGVASPLKIKGEGEKALPRTQQRQGRSGTGPLLDPYSCEADYTSPKGRRHIWLMTAYCFLMPTGFTKEESVEYRKSMRKIINSDPELKAAVKGSRKATYIEECDALSFITGICQKIGWYKEAEMPDAQRIEKLFDMRSFVIDRKEKIYSCPVQRHNCWANYHQIGQMEGSFIKTTIAKRLKENEELPEGKRAEVIDYYEGDVRYFWLTEENEHLFFNTGNTSARKAGGQISINEIPKRFNISISALARNRKLNQALGNPKDGQYKISHVRKVFSDHGIEER